MLSIRLMAIAGSPHSPVAAGTILVTDSNAARTLPNYFQVEITGTTAQRPTAGSPGFPNLPAGTSFYDSTLSKTIYFDGANWRDPTSGSVV